MFGGFFIYEFKLVYQSRKFVKKQQKKYKIIKREILVIYFYIGIDRFSIYGTILLEIVCKVILIK